MDDLGIFPTLKMTPTDYFWGLFSVRKGEVDALKRQSVQMRIQHKEAPDPLADARRTEWREDTGPTTVPWDLSRAVSGRHWVACTSSDSDWHKLEISPEMSQLLMENAS